MKPLFCLPIHPFTRQERSTRWVQSASASRIYLVDLCLAQENRAKNKSIMQEQQAEMPNVRVEMGETNGSGGMLGEGDLRARYAFCAGSERFPSAGPTRFWASRTTNFGVGHSRPRPMLLVDRDK